MSAATQLWVEISQHWARLILMWSWQSALLIVAIVVVGKAWRPASAAARHHLWLMGLAALSVLPFWGPAAQLLPIQQPFAESLPDFVRPPIVENIPTEAIASSPSQPLQSGSQAVSPVSLVWSAAFLLWLAGLTVCLANVCRSYLRLRSQRKSAVQLRSVRSSRGVEILVGYSAEVRTPQLVGILHPMILLPLDIEEWATREEIHGVLLHELAHFERRDHYAGPFQALLSSLFFFHPLVRYGLQQLSVERELACDERVAMKGVDPDVYAEAILKVAEHSVAAANQYELAFDSSRKILERRMDMILDRNGRQFFSRAAGVAASVRAVLLFVGITGLFLPRGELAAQLQNSVRPEQRPEISGTPEASPATAPVPTAAFLAAVNTFVPPAPSAPLVPAMQQPPLASLSGTVSDQTGARVPGVTVMLSSGQTTLPAVTDVSGIFNFPMVQPGEYTLEASLPGFRTQRLTNLQIDRPSQQQGLTLQIGSIVTQVQVSAPRAPSTVPVNVPPMPPRPIRIGGDIVQANLIYQPKPVYPPSMRASGIQGDVLVQAIIGVDGTVLDPRILTAFVHPDLATAAVDAVRLWRYRPTMLNGVPVETVTTITVSFGLVD